MGKSFGYDSIGHQFIIARNEVGDFGLHLSLIRSFSWGNNFPPQSPFFPGVALPYHYYFDFLVGLLERVGVPIAIALNGLSVVSFTGLLFLIYALPQIVFGRNKLLGVLSVVLFVFHSNLTFIDFLREKGISFSSFQSLWHLPDYMHKGPFDGSLISIFFTLNVYLNQRHFIAACAISLTILFFLLPSVLDGVKIFTRKLIFLGILLGLLSRFHTLTFFATCLVIFLLFILFKRFRFIVPFFTPTILIFYFHAKDILSQNLSHNFFNPGFLSLKPLTINTFFSFWFANLGIALFLIPVGYFISSKKQKMVFLSVFSLFVIGNIFQLSFLIDHNHSLFNLFIIFSNFYIAYALVKLLHKKTPFRIMFFISIVFFLTASGIIDLMAVKNDFQYPLYDAPANRFMEWIKSNTNKQDIFLSRQEIFDPVTLSGRRNYLGHSYYLSVMGYNYAERLNHVKSYFEAKSPSVFTSMKKEHITYIVIPAKPIVDYNYKVNMDFLKKSLKIVYQDKEFIVFQL